MKLKKLLSQKGLVMKSPTTEEIIARAKSKEEFIKIFYGETYDEYGNSIDSMKYYFFVANLSKSLEQEGFKTNPIILVADSAACRNVSEALKERYMKLGEERFQFVEKINKKYNLGLRIIKMSDYLHTNAFQNKLSKIKEFCKKDLKLMKKVEKSVPESKLDIERKKGFAYSFDEIATIIDLDIKVGPPREDLYDNIAREIAKKMEKESLYSIYLFPTFPLGVKFDYYISHPNIEEHGITAYKAGSKQLQDYRIIIGKTTPKRARVLINNSFISTDSELPNPVLDIGIISEMARQKLEKEDKPITLHDDFYSGKINPQELKTKINKLLYTNILNEIR